MNKQMTYKQVVDENGTIRYVPTTPPTPPPAQSSGGDQAHEGQARRRKPDSELTDAERKERRLIENEFAKTELNIDPKLTDVLEMITANNRRLRYDRRLDTGKLDGRRLTAYRTSDRLFKKRAIKDKNYQFTFLIDTSGSMHNEVGDKSRIVIAMETVYAMVSSLDAVKIPNAVISMNGEIVLQKNFGETLEKEELINGIASTMAGRLEGDIHNASGTSEGVAYSETLDFLARNTSPKCQNVVIVISDGAPGMDNSETSITRVILDDEETREVKYDSALDNIEALSTWWRRHPNILSFGIGIGGRKAKQVPTNMSVDDVKELPQVMGKLLAELML